jgi:SAM-dependent methyltransferase
MKNSDFYSKPYFANWVKKSVPEIENWHKAENQFIKRNIKKNSIVLDIGCGFGRHLKLLADLSKNAYGIDNNKFMIEKAKGNLSDIKNVKVYLKDAEKTHFKNDTFIVKQYRSQKKVTASPV